MKVATKLSGAFGLLVLLLGAMLAYEARATRRAVSTGYELSGIFSRMEQSAAEQLDDLDRLEETASKFWVTRDPRYQARFDETVASFDASVRRTELMPLGTRERVEFEKLDSLWSGFPMAARRFEAVVQTGKQPQTASDELSGLLQQVADVRLQARRLGDASREAIRVRLERSADSAREAERMALGAALAALLLAVIVAARLVGSIADSLRRLQRGTHQVAQGNFDYRLEPPREDEFAQLARDFNLMTEKLAELDRMKRDFLSKVSHDLKTPLASMQETSRIVLDGLTGDLTPKQRRLLELNLQCGQRLSGMIAKILDLSALEAQAEPTELRLQDLVPLVRQGVELTAPTFQEDRLRIALELPRTPLAVRCDGDRLLRVLDNLLENAAKFSPQGSTIRVVLRALRKRPDALPEDRWRRLLASADDGTVVGLSVVDQGPGVPPDDRERIFDRFYQAAGAGKARHRGVGLGLTICREIVEAHNGTLWVEDGPETGSAFNVALPGAVMPAPEPAPVMARIP